MVAEGNALGIKVVGIRPERATQFADMVVPHALRTTPMASPIVGEETLPLWIYTGRLTF